MSKSTISVSNNEIALKTLKFEPLRIWDKTAVVDHLISLKLLSSEKALSPSIFATEMSAEHLHDEFNRPANAVSCVWALAQARYHRQRVLFMQLHELASTQLCLHAQDEQGNWLWLPLNTPPHPDGDIVLEAIKRIQKHMQQAISVFAHGPLVGLLRECHSTPQISLNPSLFPHQSGQLTTRPALATRSPHLQQLEEQSIHILREAVAEADCPAMLYSVGKDSSVMLHLARKAFYPAPPPFPLLHVDTRWKFQDMYLLRDHMARVSGMELLVHINPEAIVRDINPFDHGSALHTDITKTEGLKQALDKYKFDVVFGGARRDEEKSRAKERIFSFRSATHRWDPKQQRPELWNLFNTRKGPGESIRVFPLSNWTELDIWQYIHQEDIPVVPLYFAKPRPVVERDGMLLMVDDNRFRLRPGEHIVQRMVRFRTLGCYPLTGAIESTASTLPEIILELVGARSSERQGRAIDSDASASMEKKKQEGYF